jgi:splicing factor U2AF subunit
MALDGIMFEGVAVRIRRPNDYNAAAAALIGPSAPSPALNLAAIGLGGGGAGAGAGAAGAGAVSAGQDQDRVFVGGLPYHLGEAECRELLGSFGGVKSFDLVKDRDTGLSKGWVCRRAAGAERGPAVCVRAGEKPSEKRP